MNKFKFAPSETEAKDENTKSTENFPIRLPSPINESRFNAPIRSPSPVDKFRYNDNYDRKLPSNPKLIAPTPLPKYSSVFTNQSNLSRVKKENSNVSPQQSLLQSGQSFSSRSKQDDKSAYFDGISPVSSSSFNNFEISNWTEEDHNRRFNLNNRESAAQVTNKNEAKKFNSLNSKFVLLGESPTDLFVEDNYFGVQNKIKNVDSNKNDSFAPPKDSQDDDQAKRILDYRNKLKSKVTNKQNQISIKSLDDTSIGVIFSKQKQDKQEKLNRPNSTPKERFINANITDTTQENKIKNVSNIKKSDLDLNTEPMNPYELQTNQSNIPSQKTNLSNQLSKRIPESKKIRQISAVSMQDRKAALSLGSNKLQQALASRKNMTNTNVANPLKRSTAGDKPQVIAPTNDNEGFELI